MLLEKSQQKAAAVLCSGLSKPDIKDLDRLINIYNINNKYH